MATIWIPGLLQDLTGNRERIPVSGATVRQVIDNLDETFPGIRARLVENDRLRPSIVVAVDGEISHLGLRQKVGEESEIHFLPAISGG